MLWVYGHYKYHLCYSFSAGIDFKRQNLTSTDVRFGRLKLIPAMKRLNLYNLQAPDIKTVFLSYRNATLIVLHGNLQSMVINTHTS